MFPSSGTGDVFDYESVKFVHVASDSPPMQLYTVLFGAVHGDGLFQLVTLERNGTKMTVVNFGY